jgi:integrase
MSNNLTMSQLREKTIARVWQGQKTVKLSAYLAGKIVAELGKTKPVATLTTRDIDDFIETLEAKGNSNGTINRQLAVLSKMLHFAKTRDYISSVPHIEFKRAGKGRDRYLTQDEEAKVLALLKLWSKNDEHDLVVFLLDTGCRIGEALKLEWHEYRGDRATFRDTKNGTTRTVPLTRRVNLMMARRAPLSVRVPFDLTYQNVRLVWDRVREHLGLKDVVIHSLRHTCASRLVQRGASIQYVKEWLGHKTLNMTMRYAHLAPTSLDSMVALLEQQPVEKPRHLGVVEGGQV